MKCVVCGCIRAEHEALESEVERLRSQLQQARDNLLGYIHQIEVLNEELSRIPPSPKQKEHV